MASSGALPKIKSPKLSETSEPKDEVQIHSSNSEFAFELKPKPKLTCIPENRSKFSDIRKTQSLSAAQNIEIPEKSWSVLYIGSKSNFPKSGISM